MPKRLIILDTETTGLNPQDGHRIIEIACIELIDRRFTGDHFHTYINPERAIDAGAQAVHGLTTEFLATKPIFAEIVATFIKYIKNAEIIAHNAPFDIGFLNHELNLLRAIEHKEYKGKSITKYATVFDTLALARKMHPGQRNNLDALCKRYKVDNTDRNVHGAMLDARLLGEVYLRMTGGQRTLFDEEIEQANRYVEKDSNVDYSDSIDTTGNNSDNSDMTNGDKQNTDRSNTRKNIKRNSATKLKVLTANAEELTRHNDYLEKMQKKTEKCKWKEE